MGERDIKNLYIACYGSNFDNYDHLYDIVDHLRFANAGVELSMFSDKREYTKRLKEQVNRFRKFNVTFHGPFVEVEASSPLSSEEHKKIINAYAEAFEIYKMFSANSIVMHTNQRAFRIEEKEQLQKNVLATIHEIARMAFQAGTNLLVENVGEIIHSNMLFDEDEFISMFDQIPPHVGCLIDVGHANINRWDMERVIKTLGSRIKAYHLHNNNGKEDSHRPIFEEGMQINAEQLFSWMEKYTPEADWILEYAPGIHITRHLMENDVKRILDIIKTL